ncbi:MAG TPA: TonB family protein [Polyangiaceae bacterium]|nr:TonB family protein [Polyangiaceae bacterium]
MFESVILRSNEPKRRFGPRALLSIGAHAIALGGLIWLSASNATKGDAAPEVTFFSPTGNGAPGKPALQQGNPEAVPTTNTAPKKPRNKSAFVPNAKPASTTASNDSAGDDDVYGSKNGDPNGSPFGDPNGTPGAGSPTATTPPPPPPPPPPTPQNVVIPFGPGMDRPHKIGGPDPAYTREAREAHVEGKMLVQCVITVDGSLSGCKVLKSLPFMDSAVLSALAQQRWAPAQVDGKPVSVLFTIPFSFKLKD